MKTRRRRDPFALNPDKILAREMKKHFQPLCEVCQKRVATVYLNECVSGEKKIKKSALCEPCYSAKGGANTFSGDATNNSPQPGNCPYCSESGDNAVDQGLPSGKNDMRVPCRPCGAEAMAFAGRTENQALVEEYCNFTKTIRTLPSYPSAPATRELKAAWLNQPENAALKSISDLLRRRVQEMGEALNRHLKATAAKRKQP
jgi:hypothetical protein